MAVAGDIVTVNGPYFEGINFIVLCKEDSHNGPLYWSVARRVGDGSLTTHLREKDVEVIGHVKEVEFKYYQEKVKPGEKTVFYDLAQQRYEKIRYDNGQTGTERSEPEIADLV